MLNRTRGTSDWGLRDRHRSAVAGQCDNTDTYSWARQTGKLWGRVTTQHANSNTNWGGTMDFALPLDPPQNLTGFPPSQKTISADTKPLTSLYMSLSSVLFPFCQVFFHQSHFPPGWVQSGCLPCLLARGVRGQKSPSFHQPNPHPLKSSAVHPG